MPVKKHPESHITPKPIWPLAEYYQPGILDESCCKHFKVPMELAEQRCFMGDCNLLGHGDNAVFLEHLETLRSIPAVGKPLGKLNLVYMDPPFAVGNDFFMNIGQARQKAYSDCWPDKQAFLDMLHKRLLLVHALLDVEGSMFLHCDWRTSAHTRILLDEVFGEEHFVNEIIWHYTGGGRSRRYFSRKHDNIFHYAKGHKWTFNIDAVRVPYKSTSNYAKGGITAKSGKKYLPNPLGTPPDDVWDIPMINPLAHERLGYPTQKPEALLQRIILAASHAGEIVGDFFCGSGTTLAVAQKLGRRWLGADSGHLAISVACQRLWDELQATEEKGVAEPGFLLLRQVCPDLDSPQVSLACHKTKDKLEVVLSEFVPSLPVDAGAELLLQNQCLYVPDKKGKKACVLSGWQSFVKSVSVGVIYETPAGIWNKMFVCLGRQSSISGSVTLIIPEQLQGQAVLQVTDIFGRVFFKPIG